MRRHRFEVALAAIASVGCAGLLTACGVSKVVDPVAQAATQSAKSGGANVAMTISVAEDGSAASVISATGVVGDGSADLTLDLGALGGSAGVGKIEELLVKEDANPVIYLNMGALTQSLGTDKKWLRLDLSKAGAFGATFSKLMAGGEQNPMDSLKALESEGDFQEVGHTTIDGEVTTHYQGTVDVAKALADKGVDLSALPGGANAQVPATVPYEVYVAADGKVRRISTSYDETVSGKTAHAEVTMDFTHWGIDPLIGPPPADQVFDATSLLSKGLGGG